MRRVKSDQGKAANMKNGMRKMAQLTHLWRPRLVATTALVLLWPLVVQAQSLDQTLSDCALVKGVLPQGCTHANAGTVVTMPVGA